MKLSFIPLGLSNSWQSNLCKGNCSQIFIIFRNLCCDLSMGGWIPVTNFLWHQRWWVETNHFATLHHNNKSRNLHRWAQRISCKPYKRLWQKNLFVGMQNCAGSGEDKNTRVLCCWVLCCSNLHASASISGKQVVTDHSTFVLDEVACVFLNSIFVWNHQCYCLISWKYMLTMVKCVPRRELIIFR